MWNCYLCNPTIVRYIVGEYRIIRSSEGETWSRNDPENGLFVNTALDMHNATHSNYLDII